TWFTFDEIHQLLQQHCGASRNLVYQGLRSGAVFQRRRASANGTISQISHHELKLHNAPVRWVLINHDLR
ncbi:MAG: hypothetical protein KC496_09730, partial [Anaerolineae bacterium]|nr:hypothetical protein [Anaerolineae bacterium]